MVHSRHTLLILAALAGTVAVRGASLSFDGPDEPVKPGVPCEVQVLLSFDSSEPAQWTNPGDPILTLNVEVPDGVKALGVEWNQSVLVFSEKGLFSDEFETYVYARARIPRGAATTTYAIATITCVGRETDDGDFYYNTDYRKNPDGSWVTHPYPTTLTITYGGYVEDLLGEQWLDEYTLDVRDLPGYLLTVVTDRREVPFSLEPLPVRIDIAQASRRDLPAPYDFVRLAFEFDSQVFQCQKDRIADTLPDFFDPQAVQIEIPMVTNILVFTNRFSQKISVVTSIWQAGVVWVTAPCAPTNYAGELATFYLLTRDIEDDCDLELAVSEDETVVWRYGVDLLGTVDEDDDGASPAIISVTPVPGLRLALEPLDDPMLAATTSVARVMIYKDDPAPVYFDYVELEMLYDDSLVYCPSNALTLSSAIAATQPDTLINIGPARYVLTNKYYAYPWTNSEVYLSLEWETPLAMESNAMEIARLDFGARAAGVIGFAADLYAIDYDLTDLIDPTAQEAEWPVAIAALRDIHAHSSLGVALAPVAGTPAQIVPGDTFDLNVVCSGGPFSNAWYELRWTYDDEMIELVEEPGVVERERVIGPDAATTSVVVAKAADVTSTASNTVLATLHWRAQHAGIAAFDPVTLALSTNVSYFVEPPFAPPWYSSAPVDLLGSPEIEDDGVYSYRQPIRRVRDLYVDFEAVTPLALVGQPYDVRVLLRVPAARTVAFDEVRLALPFNTNVLFCDEFLPGVEIPPGFTSAVTLMPDGLQPRQGHAGQDAYTATNATLAIDITWTGSVAATGTAIELGRLTILPLRQGVVGFPYLDAAVLFQGGSLHDTNLQAAVPPVEFPAVVAPEDHSEIYVTLGAPVGAVRVGDVLTLGLGASGGTVTDATYRLAWSLDTNMLGLVSADAGILLEEVGGDVRLVATGTVTHAGPEWALGSASFRVRRAGHVTLLARAGDSFFSEPRWYREGEENVLAGMSSLGLLLEDVQGLRLQFAPEADYAVVDSNATAQLVLARSLDDATAVDHISIDLQGTPNLVQWDAVPFTLNPALAGQGATVSERSVAGARLRVILDWPSATMLAPDTTLGTCTFRPVTNATLGFTGTNISIAVAGVDMVDRDYQSQEWPVLLPAYLPQDAGNQISVALEPDDDDVVRPGHEFTLNIAKRGGSVVDADYALYWSYDPDNVEVLSSSANVTTGTVRVFGFDIPTLVVRGAGFTSVQGDETIGTITVRARRPGVLDFEAVGPHCFCTNAAGRDLLGQPYTPGDGVSGCGVVVSAIEGARLNLVPATGLLDVGLPGALNVVLEKTGAEALEIDAAWLAFTFNSNALFLGEFTPSAVAADADVSLVITPDDLGPGPGRTSACDYAAANASADLHLEWPGDEIELEHDSLVLGSFELVPQSTGMIGFPSGTGALHYADAAVADPSAQAAVWPCTFDARLPNETHPLVVAELDGAGDGTIAPGARITYSITADGGPLSNASCQLAWRYDPRIVRVEQCSVGVAAWDVDGTSAVIVCSAEGLTTEDNSTVLGEVTFAARKPGVASFVPITASNYFREPYWYHEGLVEMLAAARRATLVVAPVDGLRIQPTLEGSVAAVDQVNRLELTLARDVAANVTIDALELTLLCNSNLLAWSQPVFIPDALHAGTVSSTVAIAATGLAGPVSNAPPYNTTNTVLKLELQWAAPWTSSTHDAPIGVLQFTPRAAGLMSIPAGSGAVQCEGADVTDPEAQQAVWPVMFRADTPPPRDTRVEIDLVADAASLQPGEEIGITVVGSGTALSNADYYLAWYYDPALISFVGGSAGATLDEIVMPSGETSALVSVSASTVSMPAGASTLATLTFRAEEPGTVQLTPVLPSLTSNACRFVQDGDDVLGDAQIPNDGVGGCSIAIRELPTMFFTFSPDDTLYAGKPARGVLTLHNEEGGLWDRCGFQVEFDDYEELQAVTNAWDVWLTNCTVACNEVTNLVDVLVTNAVTTVTNTQGAISSVNTPVTISNVAYRARLELVAQAPTTFAGPIAAFDMLAVDTEPWWEYVYADHGTRTYVQLNERNLLDDEFMEELDWTVYPNGVRVWIGSPPTQPVLTEPYTVTVYVDNPELIAVTGMTFCWEFDMEVMQIEAVAPVGGIQAHTWYDNSDYDGGYVCAAITCPQPLTAARTPVLTITLRPIVNDELYLEPSEWDFDDGTTVGMSVISSHAVNLLALLGDWPEDNCATWLRYPVWYDVPQIIFDDIEFDYGDWEAEVLEYDDVIDNYDESKEYEWWVKPAPTHVNIVIDERLELLTVSPDENWLGSETVHIFCRDLSSPRTGVASFVVSVVEPPPTPRIEVVEYEHFSQADTDYDIAFSVFNAPPDSRITAWALKSRSTDTNFIRVENVGTGASGLSQYVDGNGCLRWHTPLTPGFYYGTIRIAWTNSHGLTQKVDARFIADIAAKWSETLLPFTIDYKGRGRLSYDNRRIVITGGGRDDLLSVEARKGALGDDSIVLDSITTDGGFKKIRLSVGVRNIIRSVQSIKSLQVKAAVIGGVEVERGSIGSIHVSRMWHKDDEMYVETGILRGVRAYGDIGKIVMQGGFIGEDGEITAVESLNGNIGTIVTKLVKRNYDQWAELSADDGANIYASIRARNGSIGKIITVGGSIGNPSCEPGEPEISTIEAAHGIKDIIAKGVYAQGDWAYGGYIHADVFCDQDIGTIKAIAGDILREYEIDPDEYDELLNYAVTIEARSIKRIQAGGKVFLDRDFEPNPVDWYREAFGGNIGANISVVKGVDKISAKGGNVSTFLHASQGGFKSIKIRRTKYREDNWNDTEATFRGGSLVDSHITCMRNYVYRDPAGPYTGSLKKLNVQCDIIRCWFGLSGEYPAAKIQKRFKYRRLIDSEVWVDGHKVLPR